MFRFIDNKATNEKDINYPKSWKLEKMQFLYNNPTAY